jgi:ubiquinone/menaquinone biosynthesis C-methylase UbiE
VCQQGLQFFPDRLAALSEMRRALKPGGQLAIAAWSHIEDNASMRPSTRRCARVFPAI